jgi:hypothetical protein
MISKGSPEWLPFVVEQDDDKGGEQSPPLLFCVSGRLH